MKKYLSLFFLSLSLAGCAEPTSSTEELGDSIAVIPKGTTQRFWRSVEAGARLAGQELGVEIIWKGPLKENDRAMQIALVEQFVTEGVAGIVLAPLDDTALLRPVRAAGAKGIPVVIFDSNLRGEAGQDFVSFVATDNYVGGKLAGEKMAELLNGRGHVALIRFQVGSASTTMREQGFLDVMAEHEEIKVILDNQYGGATSGETIQKAEELLDTLRDADGIFSPNESTTYGMLVALRKHQLADQVVFIGFDSSEELVRALENEEIDALVVQNPHKMGFLGVKTLVQHLSGESVPVRIDTGVQLLSATDLDDPEIRKLIESE